MSQFWFGFAVALGIGTVLVTIGVVVFIDRFMHPR